MDMTLELSSRQANRLLEQARRTGATLEIEPRGPGARTTLTAVLLELDPRVIRVRLAETTAEDGLIELTGSFCDGRVQIDDELYSFSACILDVADERHPLEMTLTRPSVIQLNNRRRFERTTVRSASPISLWFAGQAEPCKGEIISISPMGLACRTGDSVNDFVCVDDHLRVMLELAGFDEPFELPAVICNKALDVPGQRLVLGLAFDVAPDDDVHQHTLQRLHAVLTAITAKQRKGGESA